MTIYVAFAGEYSSRKVIGVFDSREKVDDFSGARTREFTVQEFELNATGGEKVQPFWCVKVNLTSGDIEENWWREGPGEGGPNFHALHPVGCCIVRGPYLTGAKEDGYPYLTVSSPVGPGHAIKVAVEKRQAYLRATAAGLEEEDLDRAIGVTEGEDD